MLAGHVRHRPIWPSPRIALPPACAAAAAAHAPAACRRSPSASSFSSSPMAADLRAGSGPAQRPGARDAHRRARGRRRHAACRRRAHPPLGIDAPEKPQICRDARGQGYACGAAATQRLAALVAAGRVACASQGHDRYGRTLAVCSTAEVDLRRPRPGARGPRGELHGPRQPLSRRRERRARARPRPLARRLRAPRRLAKAPSGLTTIPPLKGEGPARQRGGCGHLSISTKTPPGRSLRTKRPPSPFRGGIKNHPQHKFF